MKADKVVVEEKDTGKVPGGDEGGNRLDIEPGHGSWGPKEAVTRGVVTVRVTLVTCRVGARHNRADSRVRAHHHRLLLLPCPVLRLPYVS